MTILPLVRCRSMPQADWLAGLWRRTLPRQFFASIVQHSQTAGTAVDLYCRGRRELLGTIGLWRCDLISRRDLFLAGGAVRRARRARGQGLAGKLRRHVIIMPAARAFRELYLSACRDFYEQLRLALHRRGTGLPGHRRASIAMTYRRGDHQ